MKESRGIVDELLSTHLEETMSANPKLINFQEIPRLI
jgi:hypothetical protein